jgi:outer membrane receptor for ferric coprogen and ferric-rhodotorulic acid
LFDDLGARFDSYEIDHLNNNTGQLDREEDDEPTYRIGATFDFNEQVTMYAVYAQTFNPTVDVRTESGEILDPETGEGFEVALKSEWFHERPPLLTWQRP